MLTAMHQKWRSRHPCRRRPPHHLGYRHKHGRVVARKPWAIGHEWNFCLACGCALRPCGGRAGMPGWHRGFVGLVVRRTSAHQSCRGLAPNGAFDGIGHRCVRYITPARRWFARRFERCSAGAIDRTSAARGERRGPRAAALSLATRRLSLWMEPRARRHRRDTTGHRLRNSACQNGTRDGARLRLVERGFA
jgi:hypothetical protein